MQRSITGLLLTAAVLLCALGACSGGKSSSSTTTATTTQSSPAASPGAMKSMSPMAKVAAGKVTTHAPNGASVYTTNCASCHQANGKGQPNVFPPLAGNMVVTGDPSKMIHIVKSGLNGKIQVGSATFNGQMPAWKGTLSDGDIAAVTTYVRSSWGNHASAVTASQVASTP